MKVQITQSICRLAILVTVFCITTSILMAVPANPDELEIRQPDGTAIKIHLRGDEWLNWIETIQGYTIAKSEDGHWRYVSKYDTEKNGRNSAPEFVSMLAQETPPAGLKKHIRPTNPVVALSPSQTGDQLSMAPYGSFSGPILFILAEFDDELGTTTEASWASFISSSIADFFDKGSYGDVTLTAAAETSGISNNGVIDWVNVGTTHPDTGGSTGTANKQLTKDAIIAADPYVNFAAFDTDADGYVDSDELAVVVIVAGYERSYSSSYTPNVWGHKWSCSSIGAPVVDGKSVAHYHSGAGGYAQFGEVHRSTAGNSHQATMGIMVHELGHLIFGLPDLYDTDYSSSGIGGWGVMGGGSWGRADADTYSGATPVLPCAWTKYNRGWVNGAIGAGIESMTAAGSGSASQANTVYRAPAGVGGEYFLVENRRPVGYDAGLQRWIGTSFGGLAIWHIDDNVSTNSADSHRKVDLEEADNTVMGTTKGESTDIWYSGNATVFDNFSSPNSKRYSGASNDVDIKDISAAGTVMTADFVPEPGFVFLIINFVFLIFARRSVI